MIIRRINAIVLGLLILPLLACADTQQSGQTPVDAGAGVEPGRTAFPEADSGKFNEARYEEGVHYLELIEPAPVSVPLGQVEVAEMFWYGCSHCYTIEPYLETWKKSLPEYVTPVSLPGVLNPRWGVHARAYFAAEVMGVKDKVHMPLFKAIHEQGRRLNSEDALARFVALQGVDEAAFRKTMNSMIVASKLHRARQLGQQYELAGVPAIIVAGKYRVMSQNLSGYDEIFDVADFLINKERLRQKSGS